MAQHALQSSGMPAHHVDSRSSTTHCLCTSVPTHSELSSWQRRDKHRRRPAHDLGVRSSSRELRLAVR
jgi:hypothetical protein